MKGMNGLQQLLAEQGKKLVAQGVRNMDSIQGNKHGFIFYSV